MGPWDPNWRPDPTGRRLEAIRVARRGALAAAVIFGALEVLATVVGSPVRSGSWRMPHRSLGLMLALFSLPALALLGAGLTSAALGTPSTAASAGLAMGVGVPVAAVTLGDDRSLRARRHARRRVRPRSMGRTWPRSCCGSG